MERPLILVTNDDGIDSQGLWAAAEALLALGELLVVAPASQWSGAGRSMPQGVSGDLTPVDRAVKGRPVIAYAIDATPALSVFHAVLDLVPRSPALVVSGINSGENIGNQITVSGTVGAALEAASVGIPSLAVSLEMAVAYHLTNGDHVDYTAAAAYTRRFANLLLNRGLPYDVDVLNVNVPADATPQTPWRFTRVSRHSYFVPRSLEPGEERAGHKAMDDPAMAEMNTVDGLITLSRGYKAMDDPAMAEPDSDIWVLRQERLVSVTPLSIDLTSRVDFGVLEERFRTQNL